jgi:hypothetical protein
VVVGVAEEAASPFLLLLEDWPEVAVARENEPVARLLEDWPEVAVAREPAVFRVSAVVRESTVVPERTVREVGVVVVDNEAAL